MPVNLADGEHQRGRQDHCRLAERLVRAGRRKTGEGASPGEENPQECRRQLTQPEGALRIPSWTRPVTAAGSTCAMELMSPWVGLAVVGLHGKGWQPRDRVVAPHAPGPGRKTPAKNPTGRSCTLAGILQTPEALEKLGKEMMIRMRMGGDVVWLLFVTQQMICFISH